MNGSGTARSVCLLALMAALALPSDARAGEPGHVRVTMLAVVSKGQGRGATVAVLPQDTLLDVVQAAGGWYRVLLPADRDGKRLGGWIPAVMVEPVPDYVFEPTPPAVRAARAGTSAAAPARVAPAEARSADVPPAGAPDAALESVAPPPVVNAPRAPVETAPGRLVPYPAPPEPAGSAPAAPGAPGGWVNVRSLRANLGAGYEGIGFRDGASAFDEQGVSEGVGVAGSLSLIDPRVLSLDAALDLRGVTARRSAASYSYRNRNGLRNYRVELTALSGRGIPLRVFADRATSDTSLRTIENGADGTQHTAGTRDGQGVSWDVRLGGWPRLQFSASNARQRDVRDYLFGFDSETRERRAELRGSQEWPKLRYEVSYDHGTFRYEVPAASTRSDTATDLLHVVTRSTPVERLTLDANGRFSQFRLGVGGRDTRVSGAGGDVAARWAFTPSVSASARASFSTNAFEALLSGSVRPEEVGVDGRAVSLRTDTLFYDLDGRLAWESGGSMLAAVVRSIDYGMPATAYPALGWMRTAGPSGRLARAAGGFTFVLGADAMFGTAGSTGNQREPYREVGGLASVSRSFAGVFRLAGEASARRTGRLSFYPVVLEALALGGRLELDRLAWARLRLAASWSKLTRDVLYADNRDGLATISLGLSGPRYDLAFDMNDTDTNLTRLPASVLGARLDAAILLSTRPELFAAVIGGATRGRAASLSIRPFGALQVRARVRRDRQRYPGLYEFRIESEQAWLVYQIRQVQLEAGWEHVISISSFAAPADRRFYVRIRRDITIF